MLVSSAENFEVSRSLGFTIQGMKSRHRKKAEKMQPGDRILYYLTGVQQFGGTATITSTYVEDHSPIWNSKKKGEDYPFRVQINPDVILNADQFIDAKDVVPHMEYVKRWPAEHWHLAFQGNVHLFSEEDFSLIEKQLSSRKAASPTAAS
jgi:predicted RNA-binding protein